MDFRNRIIEGNIVDVDKQYNELIEKWGEDKISEVQAVLSDENKTYQNIEGEFIELDQDGKGTTPKARKLDTQLLRMADEYLTNKQKQGQLALW